MVKKFSEFLPVNEDVAATEVQPAPAPVEAAPLEIAGDVTNSSVKTINSSIHISMKELEKMFFDAHTRIKNQDLGDRPLLEIQAEDGHTIKIMLYR